ncbi:MAG: DNA topoisomerase I [Pseudomonadota bacterium]
MTANLLIVESPAKAKTINKYLGKDFVVLASYGHVRDLVPKEGAVDTGDFSMKYATIERNAKHVDAIVKAMRKADALYLATDLDREGEAISWHVHEILKEKKVLKEKPVFRVVFSEITKKAISDAVANPREISMNMVNAQQARRALDYLVGFNLSPLLWKKVRRGLSAGRVQSPALRMICERENEIEAFEPREYWTIEADLNKKDQPFTAKLVEFNGEKLDQFDLNTEELAVAAKEKLLEAAQGKLKVGDLTSRQRRRRPAPPFITSTLQQDAARKLRFSAQKTMRVAQQLYEGVEVDGAQQGLITYMRTDSVTLSNDALDELRGVIAEDFGKDKLPEQANTYKTKSKNAQEAHEAIRPTAASQRPANIKAFLSEDQFKLYELIWRRTVACQMNPAIMNTVTATFPCGDGASFRASGSTVVEPGFLAVYEEAESDKKKSEPKLPPLEKGEVVDLTEIRGEQHFTEPPPRFSEASLVKALEEYGIGRPSTYANIIQTLVNREYVELESRRFFPTDVGRIVSRFLSDHFTRYVDYDFTAQLEDNLDEVSRGEREWVPLLKEFWDPFTNLVQDKEESVTRDEVLQARELGTDPKSGKPISVRMGRFGPYVQIGTKDDEEKPKFAGLLPGQKMDQIDLEQALELFKLPRELGKMDDDFPITANIGRFGPYVRFGQKSFVSIKAPDDPYSIDLARALELIEEKKKADAERIIKSFDGSEIQVLKGRYGPYVTDGKKNGRIPKDREPETLTLTECEEIIAAAPARKKRGKKRATKKKAKTA